MENINQEPERREEVEKNIAEVVRENFSRWAESLKTKDPKEVAKLYSKDATFLPTVSPDFKHGPSETEEYFVHFLEKNPEGEIKDESMQQLGEDSYLHSGLYDFVLDGEDGRKTVEARFSFVWKRNNDVGWEIVHHHSSVRPQ